MKRISIICLPFIVLISFFSCNGQSKAVEDEKKALEALKQYSPKGVSPSNSIYMKARIDGKAWEATTLIPDPDPDNSYHVSGEKDGVQIAFYVPISNVTVGSVHKFSESHAADFLYTDKVVFYGGRTGTYTVTKLDDDGFEVSFQFTAANAQGKGSVFEISEGTLRFPLHRRK